MKEDKTTFTIYTPNSCWFKADSKHSRVISIKGQTNLRISKSLIKIKTDIRNSHFVVEADTKASHVFKKELSKKNFTQSKD